jgi:uncharacterized protein (TIGR04222 family)
MNPLDMRGPVFLVFYLLVSGIGLFVMYLVSKGLFTNSPRAPTGQARRLLRDPYLLAYLRGGARQTLETLAFSLNRRKLLSSVGDNVVTTRSKEALQAVRQPLELALLSQCGTTRLAGSMLQDSALHRVVDRYVQPLRDSGLIADGAELGRRLPAFIVIAGGLLALGATKIYVALQRGHTNVAFLIVLMLLALFLAVVAFRRRRTCAGDRALSDQQTLFARLRNRVQNLASDGATDEATLIAAAYGLADLPATHYPFAARLRRQNQQSSSDSSSSCGSSCGSSCSSGSSCGGGGGCGGCGS